MRTGDEFDQLKVLALVRGAKNVHPVARCECKCGRKRTVRQSVLRRAKATGTAISCAACSCKRGWAGRPRIAGTERAISRTVEWYRSNAKRKGIAFGLTRDDCRALFAGACNYCGIAPSRTTRARGSGSATVNGIDRLDSAKGYEAGNVASCCDQCNYAKRSMTVEVFLAWVERVAAFQRGKR